MNSVDVEYWLKTNNNSNVEVCVRMVSFLITKLVKELKFHLWNNNFILTRIYINFYKSNIFIISC